MKNNKHNNRTTGHIPANPKTPPLRMQRPETPEQWWAKLGPVQRAFAHEIARVVDEVTDTKRLEIRRDRGEVRARFIYLLRQAEPGCLSAIVLPEIPAD